VTKGKKSTPEEIVLGEGMTFYGEEEVIIAINEGLVSQHAFIKCKVSFREENGELVEKIVETVAGRLIFNQFVPEEVGFVNELLTKKKLTADYF
jgi:DNA-directed RNA polymerase subunit beta'